MSLFERRNQAANALLIDIGNSVVKCGLSDRKNRTLRVVPLGQVGQSTFPATIYIPEAGPIRVGAAAEQHASDDPAGTVRNILKSLDKSAIRVRNGRKVTSLDLLTTSLAQVREEVNAKTQGSYANADVWLIYRGSARQESIDALQFAAEAAGYRNVRLLSSFIALASSHLSSLGPPSPFCAVADIGATRTDLAFLKFVRGNYRVHLGVETTSAHGTEQLESKLWDTLSDQFSEAEIPGSQFAQIRVQLRKIVEASGKLAASQFIEVAGNTVEVEPTIHQETMRSFLQDCLAGLARMIEELPAHADPKDVPLVIGGGGANLPGIRAAAIDCGWIGPVHVPEHPQYAAICGAARFANSNDSIDWKIEGINDGFGSQNPDTNDYLAPHRVGVNYLENQPVANSLNRCREAGCGRENPIGRLYCFGCGSPLIASHEID